MRLPLRSTPALTQVDTEIFELSYFARCMSCGFCKDACCQHGADVNVGERDRILAQADSIKARVNAPVEQWFTTEVYEDPEYPTGRYVRAQVVNEACVFLNRQGRGCQLQSWAIEKGRDYHDIKPMVCWMFPVVYDQGILRASFDVRDGLVCVGEGVSLYRGAREEIGHYFGGALIEELDLLEAKRKAGQ